MAKQSKGTQQLTRHTCLFWQLFPTKMCVLCSYRIKQFGTFSCWTLAVHNEGWSPDVYLSVLDRSVPCIPTGGTKTNRSKMIQFKSRGFDHKLEILIGPLDWHWLCISSACTHADLSTSKATNSRRVNCKTECDPCLLPIANWSPGRRQRSDGKIVRLPHAAGVMIDTTEPDHLRRCSHLLWIPYEFFSSAVIWCYWAICIRKRTNESPQIDKHKKRNCSQLLWTAVDTCARTSLTKTRMTLSFLSHHLNDTRFDPAIPCTQIYKFVNGVRLHVSWTVHCLWESQIDSQTNGKQIVATTQHLNSTPDKDTTSTRSGDESEFCLKLSDHSVCAIRWTNGLGVKTTDILRPRRCLVNSSCSVRCAPNTLLWGQKEQRSDARFPCEYRRQFLKK